MSHSISGNLKGLSPSEIKAVERFARRKLEAGQFLSIELGRELLHVSKQIGRKIGLLISRAGKIEGIVVGSKTVIYLPDLGRFRFGKGRLRNLRLLFPDLAEDQLQPKIPLDVYADLEKLRLDMVIAVKEGPNRLMATYAYISPDLPSSSALAPTEHKAVTTIEVKDVSRLDQDFSEFITDLEGELDLTERARYEPGKVNAILVGVYDCASEQARSSMQELAELSNTAGVKVVERIIQRRRPDPRSVLGSGKLEEVILSALRLGAEMLIFDTELSPSQWRIITNSTELKVIDRSMLILDIFAQRAKSSDGKLQVELAQLKYNLPRLVEKDKGLSRLTGGLGGRGPGETKLEIGRRRIRDRITDLERKTKKLGSQRELRRKRRKEYELPVVSIVGYTNAGKSTLFNTLTVSQVMVEDKLFATLDPTHRRLRFPNQDRTKLERNRAIVLTDTVGFIRDLPKELVAAFKATLEELAEADLLLHVLDSSDKEIESKYSAVQEILSEMGLSEIPQIVVLSKSDRVDQQIQTGLEKQFDGVSVSSTARLGLESLLARIEECLYSAAASVPLEQKLNKDELYQ